MTWGITLSCIGATLIAFGIGFAFGAFWASRPGGTG
jgi:hypothetical protein